MTVSNSPTKLKGPKNLCGRCGSPAKPFTWARVTDTGIEFRLCGRCSSKLSPLKGIEVFEDPRKGAQ